jgi:mannosyl-3-phosphoglycerate phosphatase
MNLELALVIVTDVDACLLDDRTYSPEGARAALEALRQQEVPVVLCSSKTRAELIAVQEALAIAGPFISENGGGLHLPPGYFPFEIPGVGRRNGHALAVFGRPRPWVLERLRRTAAQTGVSIVGFSDMSPEQIAADCGLTLRQAELAGLRDYDEPFRVIDPDPQARTRLHSALRAAGVHVTAGGRYDHATGPTDKGGPTAYLRCLFRAAYGRTIFVGLGDALNDAPLLRSVDVPIIVRAASGARTAALQKAVPGARVTHAVGPVGWQEAVFDVLTARQRWLCEKGRQLPVAGKTKRAPTETAA